MRVMVGRMWSTSSRKLLNLVQLNCQRCDNFIPIFWRCQKWRLARHSLETNRPKFRVEWNVFSNVGLFELLVGSHVIFTACNSICSGRVNLNSQQILLKSPRELLLAAAIVARFFPRRQVSVDSKIIVRLLFGEQIEKNYHRPSNVFEQTQFNWREICSPHQNEALIVWYSLIIRPGHPAERRNNCNALLTWPSPFALFPSRKITFQSKSARRLVNEALRVWRLGRTEAQTRWVTPIQIHLSNKTVKRSKEIRMMLLPSFYWIVLLTAQLKYVSVEWVFFRDSFCAACAQSKNVAINFERKAISFLERIAARQVIIMLGLACAHKSK